MKRIVTIVMVALLARGAAGDEHPTLRGREAPSVTDLLRAERLAEQAQKRLGTSKKRGPGWVRGGSGWDAPGAGGPPASPPVIINMRSPKRPARTE